MLVEVESNRKAVRVHKVIITDMQPGLMQVLILHSNTTAEKRTSFGQRKTTDLAISFRKNKKKTVVRLKPSLPHEEEILGGTIVPLPTKVGSAYMLVSPKVYLDGGREEICFNEP